MFVPALPSPDLIRCQLVWAQFHSYQPRLFLGPAPLGLPSLWYVLEGDCVIEGTSEAVALSAGQWLWFPSTPRRRISFGETGMKWLSAGIAMRLGERNLLAPIKPQVWQLEPSENEKGLALLRQVIDSFDESNSWEKDGLARALAGWIWRVAQHGSEGLPWPDWLSDALARIESEPAVSIAALAADAHFSAAQFRRLWHAQLGQSPQQTLQNRRLLKAKAALENETWSIEKVALHSGFSSAQTLTRAFNKEYGLAPLAWRRMVQQGN